MLARALLIGLILESRDSVVAAVVTGRLDVRNARIIAVDCGDPVDEAGSEDEDLEDAVDADELRERGRAWRR